jgi:starch synthase
MTQSPSKLRILVAAAEVTPFAKTGGLAEVAGSLPRAVAAHGHDVAVIMPLYRSAWTAGLPLRPLDVKIEVPVGPSRVAGRLWQSHLRHCDVPVYLLEHHEFFSRDDARAGHTIYQYKGGDGHLRDYEDNGARFVFFNRAVLDAMPALGFWPDVVHVNDWHTGLIPVYLRTLYARDPRFRSVRSLLTIHNLAYQGRFPKEDLSLTGLDWDLFKYEMLEFYDGLNFLKAGIVFADAVNAVSQRYAQEIQTRENGYDLDDVLRVHRYKLFGIMNGVDYDTWNPASDPFLAAKYTPETVRQGKAVCKADLQRTARLPTRVEVPVIGIVTRLAEQKGIDLIKAAAWELMTHDVQLVILGTGETHYQNFFTHLAHEFPYKVASSFEFNEALAHKIIGGADLFLMPSRFEPAGLNQLYSLKYGTVPVVRDTGGLSDSVADCNEDTLRHGTATGFVFGDYHPGALLWAVRRALSCYHGAPEVWHRLQTTGMAQDWSWDHGAREYEKLYRRLVAMREAA